MNTFEINMENVVKDADAASLKVKTTSPVVEIFSALIEGKDMSRFDGKKVDKTVEYIKELGSKALAGDSMAISEINAIQRFVIEPKLIEAIKIFSFMGQYKSIPYDTVPMMRTYKYESVDSRWQANSGDVPFAATSWSEYPIATQTISGGFAVDYRELQSGNFGGSVAEGMEQVKIDMQNKAVYYVIAKLYDALENCTSVKHFAESNGITKSGVDDMLKIMRRYGRVNICGDYSVVSQMNDFVGYKTIDTTTIPYGGDAVAEEIRKNGLLSYYNSAAVVELPNSFNYTKPLADKTSFELYMPEGLLFFIPTGNIAPLQIFRRGGLTTMTGDDIVTRQHLTRFDLEIGAGVAKGMEHLIGLISDTNFSVPTL
jgi:hypothetical protein